MYLKKIIILNLFISLASFYIFSNPKITNIFPRNPVIGLPVFIEGKGFKSTDNIKLFMDNNEIFQDSINILQWDDEMISLILPNNRNNSTILKLSNSGKKEIRTINFSSSLPIDYFNYVAYNLKYSVRIENILDRSNIKGNIYVYIPQPFIDDEIISCNVISKNIEPDYIQDNNVLIYKIDPEKQNNFYFEEIIEITTSYKKINIDVTCDNIDYNKNSEIYRIYTGEEIPFIIPNNKKVKETLKKIIGEETNTLKIIKLIYDWVGKKMIHEYPPENRSPVYAINNGKGDCLSDAYLFATLIRSAGIPVRLNSGYILYHQWKVGGLHFWEDVFVPGIGWIPVDMSFGHNSYFLKYQKYPTNTGFYLGGIDGRRVALSKGFVKLMLPDNDSNKNESYNLIFNKNLSNLQVPYVECLDKKNLVEFKLFKNLYINDIKLMYNYSEDWFLKNR